MATFLVELYALKTATLAALEEQARSAAAEMRRRGSDIAYLRTILVPEDETCFHFFEAASVRQLTDAIRETSLPAGRIVAAAASYASSHQHPQRSQEEKG